VEEARNRLLQLDVIEILTVEEMEVVVNLFENGCLKRPMRVLRRISHAKLTRS
jgi:cobalamin-dependent methionine synthase I